MSAGHSASVARVVAGARRRRPTVGSAAAGWRRTVGRNERGPTPGTGGANPWGGTAGEAFNVNVFRGNGRGGDGRRVSSLRGTFGAETTTFGRGVKVAWTVAFDDVNRRRRSVTAAAGDGDGGFGARRGFETASTSSADQEDVGAMSASPLVVAAGSEGVGGDGSRRLGTKVDANRLAAKVDAEAAAASSHAAAAPSRVKRAMKRAMKKRARVSSSPPSPSSSPSHPRVDDADQEPRERRGRRPPSGGPSSGGRQLRGGPSTNRRAGRYNRPPAGGGRPDVARGGGFESEGAAEERERKELPRHRWLSHQRGSRGPEQQPQQRRARHKGNKEGGGMRAGERIVKAMEALPRASVHRMHAAEQDPDADAFGSPLESDADALGRVPSADPRRESGGGDPGVDASAEGYRSVEEAVTSPGGRPATFSAPTLNFAIKELGERGNFERAHALYLWMRMQRPSRSGAVTFPKTNVSGGGEDRGKYAPNRYTLVSLFGAATEKAHARVVVKVWREALLFTPDMITSEVGSAAITALGRCDNWPAAYQVWKDMGDVGEPRNLYAYTAMLTVLREAQRWEEAADVFRAMRDEAGVKPDALCAGLMLAAFDGARRWREANAIAKRLVDVYAVEPDEHLAHTIITLAGRAGDMAHARAAHERMVNSPKLCVTTYSYNCLLGGYARNGDWDGAARVLDDLRRAHLRPDSYTFTHLVSAAERSERYEEADQVWSLMLNSKIRPHTVMCGAYVHCLGCQGRWMEAEALIEQMRDRWGVKRNAAVYNALLGALVRADKLERALDVFDEMQHADGILPTEITFMLLVRACQENGMARRAKELAGVRDALAEAGALENDFSKYAAGPIGGALDGATAPMDDAAAAAAAASARMGDADVRRMAAGLPPEEHK